MAIRRWVSTFLLPLAAVTPARGQSVLDTVHQLRSTFGQLGGRRRPASTPTGEAPPTSYSTPASSTPATDAGGLVPANVLADDASDTALERAPLVPRRVATFDVRGFKLGMSPREVGRIADREGFRRRWNSTLLTSGSFEVEAARLANQRLNRPVERTSSLQLKVVQGIDAAGDTLACEFTLEPTGPKLSKVEYKARLNGSTREQAIAALVRRYGPTHPPPGAPDDDVAWSNASKPLDYSSPELIAVFDENSMSLFLGQSTDYYQAARRRLEDRAQQLAASRGGGVRF